MNPERGAMVRAKPPKFQRPSVDLDRHGRKWVFRVPVTELLPGDVVKGEGLVESVKIEHFEPHDESTTGFDLILVTFLNGDVVPYDVWWNVEAFVRPRTLTDDSE